MKSLQYGFLVLLISLVVCQGTGFSPPVAWAQGGAVGLSRVPELTAPVAELSMVADNGAGIRLLNVRAGGSWGQDSVIRLRGGGKWMSKRERELLLGLSNNGTIYSSENMGEWEDIKDTLLPTAQVEGEFVKVKVDHKQQLGDGMTAEQLDFIEFIWILDADSGEPLNAKALDGDEDVVEVLFDDNGSLTGRKVTPYCLSYKHGVVKGETVEV